MQYIIEEEKFSKVFKKDIDTTSKVCYNIIVKRNGKEQNKKIKKSSKKVLTNKTKSVIITM